MFRKRLVASVAAAPLLLFASQALAEIVITDTKTTPVLTSTGADTVRISTTGKINPTATAGGGSLIVDSSHSVINEGAIATRDINGTAGILVNGGVTADVTNKGTITVDEVYTDSDTDGDGDLDGAFAEGTGRYGIRVTGAGTYTGAIFNDVAANITVHGNNSAGISVESPLVGTVHNRGAIVVLGDNSYGVRIAPTAPVTGDVKVRGTVSVVGENAVGVAVDSDVSGQVLIQGAISARGYRYATRPSTVEARTNLEADDKLQGGPAVRVTGNVAGGILLDTPPANLDANNDDEDADGIADASEGSAVLSVQGSAPALLVGSDTANTTIGVVGAGDLAYGMVIRGSITSEGILDDKSATGVQIGGNGGFTTTVTGGMRLDGLISAQSYNAEAQGLHLKAGANVDTLWNKGVIVGLSTSTSAPLATESSYNVRGVRIDSGATINTIRNGGNITAAVNGEKSNAIAIQDLSGTLGLIENSGTIAARITATDDSEDTDDADFDPTNEQIVGRAIAIDVRAATGDVTVRQYGIIDGDDDGDATTVDPDADGDGVDDADEPILVGDVLFGAGNDTFDLQNGTFYGTVEFGAGADTYNISGGAEARGAITDSDGQLSLNITNGKLTVTSTAVIDATSVTMGANGALIVTADPGTGTNTRFDVATANLATGAKIGLELKGLISGPERYIVIHTDTPAGLTAGVLSQELLGSAPYLMVAQAGADTATGDVYLDVRRRTATEMSLTGSNALALDAVYEALGGDTGVRDAFLSATDRSSFVSLYQQMLPDQGDGVFSAIDSLTTTVSRLTGTRPDLRQRYGPDSFWMQEINVQVMRDAGVSMGSETKAFGFVGGYESMGADGGALGATLAFMNAEERDDVAQVGEETNVSLLEAGLYWRRSVGGWLFSARGSGGYAWFEGNRVFTAPSASLIRESEAKWSGVTGAASASVAYEARAGRYFVRPRMSVDYLYMSEGSRQETGGQDAFNLYLEDRTSSRLTGTAEVAFGATFGRELWWRPEVRLGYRQNLSGEMGDTIFRFKSGQLVTLPGSATTDGAVIFGLSLKAGTPMSYVAMEAEYETADGEDRYNLQLAGRMMF
ncbi:MAG: autotransporter outer membrane beta-barrel domain-containing protein [Caulobacter sp.]|nr:autotransporter outer membrane beta-barrel domain-containing protein [Caulobacter sp.]